MPNLGGLIKPLGILVVQDGEDVKQPPLQCAAVKPHLVRLRQFFFKRRNANPRRMSRNDLSDET